MLKGTIAALMGSTWGFIKTEQGEDLSFNHNDLEGVDYENLSEGQVVVFEMGLGHKGLPKATRVRLDETQTTDDEVVDQVKNHRGGGETEG